MSIGWYWLEISIYNDKKTDNVYFLIQKGGQEWKK